MTFSNGFLHSTLIFSEHWFSSIGKSDDQEGWMAKESQENPYLDDDDDDDNFWTDLWVMMAYFIRIWYDTDNGLV